MTIFARLDKVAAQARSRELIRMADDLIFEGQAIMREFRECIDDEAMQKLNGWWVRVSHLLQKCEHNPRHVA